MPLADDIARCVTQADERGRMNQWCVNCAHRFVPVIKGAPVLSGRFWPHNGQCADFVRRGEGLNAPSMDVSTAHLRGFARPVERSAGLFLPITRSGEASAPHALA